MTLHETIAARSMPEPNTGCLLWTGAANKLGYGIIDRGGRRQFTHRIAYEIANGPIPSGLYVCHRCDTPACCNADHLFLGTLADNDRDMWRKGRAKAGQHQRSRTHCPRGHEYTSENTYIYQRPSGYMRACRICRLAAGRRFYHKARASATVKVA